MIEYFVYMVVCAARFACGISLRRQPIPFSGLSPSIHSIDQIKVVDRFRGRPNSVSETFPLQCSIRNTARGPNGRPGVVRSRSRKRRFCNITAVIPISRLSVCPSKKFTLFIVALAIRSAPALCTNFLRQTICHISSVLTNYAWRATRRFSKSTCRQCGPPQIIAIDAEIPLVY